jgi:hypothetical protein
LCRHWKPLPKTPYRKSKRCRTGCLRFAMTET